MKTVLSSSSFFCNFTVISISSQLQKPCGFFSQNSTAGHFIVHLSSVTTSSQSELYLVPPNQIDSLRRSLLTEVKSIPMTALPCLNGIFKVSNEVFDDNKRMCRITSMAYRFRDRCAQAKIVRYGIILTCKPLSTFRLLSIKKSFNSLYMHKNAH